MLGLKLNHVSKRGHSSIIYKANEFNLNICLPYSSCLDSNTDENTFQGLFNGLKIHHPIYCFTILWVKGIHIGILQENEQICIIESYKPHINMTRYHFCIDYKTGTGWYLTFPSICIHELKLKFFSSYWNSYSYTLSVVFVAQISSFCCLTSPGHLYLDIRSVSVILKIWKLVLGNCSYLFLNR